MTEDEKKIKTLSRLRVRSVNLQKLTIKEKKSDKKDYLLKRWMRVLNSFQKEVESINK